MAAKQDFNFKSSGKSISRVKSELSKINKEEEKQPVNIEPKELPRNSLAVFDTGDFP